MLLADDDLEQATLDALHALGHLGLMAGACREFRFEAAVERSLGMLVSTVKIDLSRIGDVADSSVRTVPPTR